MRKKDTAEPVVAEKVKKAKDILDVVIAEQNKKAGRNLVMKASDPRLIRGVLSTGNVALDEVLGGGFVKGLSVEIFGTQGSGKTALVTTVIKEAQKDDPKAIQFYFGSESDIPMEYIEANNIDHDKLVIVRPLSNAEESLNAILSMLRALRESLTINLIVIDSVAALAPKSETDRSEEAGIETADMAPQARLLSKLNRLISGGGYLADGAVFIMTNQERTQIGHTPMPNTTPGGMANRFYCKTRLRLTCPKADFFTRKPMEFLANIDERAAEVLDELGDKDIAGHTVIVDVVKLNTGRGKPNSKTSYRVIYGYGVDQYTPIIDSAMKYGVISVKGAFYTYKGVTYHGRENLMMGISENKLWDELRKEMLEAKRLKRKRISDLSITQVPLEEMDEVDIMDVEVGELEEFPDLPQFIGVEEDE